MASPRLTVGSLCAGLLVASSTASLSRTASAAPSVSVHIEAAAARPVGDAKSEQFSWGGSGVVAPELVLARSIGLELAVGAMGLSDGHGMDPKGVAPTTWGFAAFSTVGPRVRPLAWLAKGKGAFGADGLWLSGGVGAGLASSEVKPALRASLGFDALSSVAGAGPFVGYFQMIQPDGGLRPEDARVVVFGVHGVLAPPARPPVPAPVNNDRDGDGIENAKDKCPDEAEDKDGFEDEDGCPDVDNDKDGIPDTEDACPNVAEDKDGFEDEDGCPDLDNDKDGIPDAKDACPNIAEDKDGFEDEDGCPDLDNDKDGVLDVNDRCPNEPETINGFADEDGCPDSEHLHVDGDFILLDDRIHFDTDSAKVKIRSWGLVKSLADFLVAHPEYKLVHVAGHADDTGTADYNLSLSDARAEAVRAMLVRFGVQSTRLTIEAYGETRPLQRGQTDEARTTNRRVEFEILTRAAQPTSIGSSH